MPSGRPSDGSISANLRRSAIAPVAPSKSKTSMRCVVLSVKYIRSPATLQTRPFEMVVFEITHSISRPGASRYREAAPGDRSFDIVPAQRRPCGSHLQSLKRLVGRSSSTSASTFSPSPSARRMRWPAASTQPLPLARGTTALTSPSCCRHQAEPAAGLQPWTLPFEMSTRSSWPRRSSQNGASPSWSLESDATLTAPIDASSERRELPTRISMGRLGQRPHD
jgi:hypothetical protein